MVLALEETRRPMEQNKRTTHGYIHLIFDKDATKHQRKDTINK